jgi:polysaccharide biosynthesis/export protein
MKSVNRAIPGSLLAIMLLLLPTRIPAAQEIASSASSPSANVPPQPASYPKEFVIGLQDQLSISVWKEPDLSLKEVVVRPDGKIGMPLAGEIQAQGLTTQQLQEKITERLKEYIAAPVVTVSITKISSSTVSVVGQVAKPGAYILGAPMTVLELLARAGGVTLDAKSKKIKVLRKEGNQTRQFDFNYNDAANGRNLQDNIVLQSGDVVVVP